MRCYLGRWTSPTTTWFNTLPPLRMVLSILLTIIITIHLPHSPPSPLLSPLSGISYCLVTPAPPNHLIPTSLPPYFCMLHEPPSQPPCCYPAIKTQPPFSLGSFCLHFSKPLMLPSSDSNLRLIFFQVLHFSLQTTMLLSSHLFPNSLHPYVPTVTIVFPHVQPRQPQIEAPVCSHVLGITATCKGSHRVGPVLLTKQINSPLPRLEPRSFCPDTDALIHSAMPHRLEKYSQVLVFPIGNHRQP